MGELNFNMVLLDVNITILVSIFIAVMFLLIISFLLAFIFNQRRKFQYRQKLQQLNEQQQNQLIKAAVRSEEIASHRISEELHDEVGALLSATKLYMGHIEPEGLDAKSKGLLTKTLELLDDSITKVRSISHNLHSAILKELGLNEAIRSFFQKIGQGASLETIVELDFVYQTGNPENDISIYRIIQELCNNIIKHGKATRLKIYSTAKNEELIFTLNHNGNGLSQEAFERLRFQSNGLGLKNIQNRIILLKGAIQFESEPDNHSIVLTIPLIKTA